jgi:hypothetical protein
MKTRIPIAASAVLIAAAIALTGCSSGGLPGTSSGAAAGSGTSGGGSGSGGSGGSGPTKNYSADELVAILKAAEPTTGTGKIQDDAQLKAVIGNGKDIENFTSQFAKEGGKFEPAICGTYIDDMTQDAANYGQGATGIGAENSTTNDLLGLSTSNSASASALASKLASVLDGMATNCGSSKIVITTDGTTESIPMKIKKLSISTDADSTYAYEESFTLPGSGSDSSLSAVGEYGNLFISDTEINGGTIAGLEKNINALVAAAKSN